MSNKQKGDKYEEEIKIIAKSTDIAFCYGKKIQRKALILLKVIQEQNIK